MGHPIGGGWVERQKTVFDGKRFGSVSYWLPGTHRVKDGVTSSGAEALKSGPLSSIPTGLDVGWSVFRDSNAKPENRRSFMRRQTLASAVRMVSLLCLTAANCALAQWHAPQHFTGVINDYTPANPNLKGSPWEMHGQWSLDLHEWAGTADFVADMTMSGYGTTNGAPDGTKGGQSAHTHHIKLTNVRITWDMNGCPPYSSPVPTEGFQINGTVSLITGNGNSAPFEPAPPAPPTSTLQVCVTGGSEVTYANMTMVFGGPATMHFGTQAIHGVVRKADGRDEQKF